MKQCTGCKRHKPLSEFYREAKQADGHAHRCKTCKRAYGAAWRAANPGYFAAWRAANADALSEYEQPRTAARRTDPKQRARVLLHCALERGDVAREPCLFCGAERVEAHHHDYTLPLAVTWLCAPHHRRIHATERRLSHA